MELLRAADERLNDGPQSFCRPHEISRIAALTLGLIVMACIWTATTAHATTLCVNQGGLDFLQDCPGTITSLGYNVMMEPDCSINATTGDQFYARGSIVGPLQNNGGATQTHALLPGSPAIDAADNNTCPHTDQRGFPRPAFGGKSLRCGVGAYELQQTVYLPQILR